MTTNHAHVYFTKRKFAMLQKKKILLLLSIIYKNISQSRIVQLVIQYQIKSKWSMNLVPGVLAHVQPPHPHV